MILFSISPPVTNVQILKFGGITLCGDNFIVILMFTCVIQVKALVSIQKFQHTNSSKQHYKYKKMLKTFIREYKES